MQREDFSILTREEKSWRRNEMAAQIASLFGLHKAGFEWVGDLEGFSEPGGRLAYVKFKTTTSDSTYLLTIYYAFSGTPDPSGLDRQLAFLHWAEHLAMHGIQVPVKIPDLKGNTVCKATLNLSSGTSVQCASVLDAWIKGDALETSSEQDVVELADLMARMHEISEGWTYPPGLGDRFDHTVLEPRQASISIPFEEGKVSMEYLEVAEATLQKVIDRVRVLPKNDQAWGPCHLDLNTYNCLRIPGNICPIDFDSSGLSFFAYDIARVIEGYPAKRRKIFLASYQRRRRLPENIRQLLETFILMNRFRWWINWADRPSVKWGEWVPKFVLGECSPYLAGRSFLEQDPP